MIGIREKSLLMVVGLAAGIAGYFLGAFSSREANPKQLAAPSNLHSSETIRPYGANAMTRSRHFQTENSEPFEESHERNVARTLLQAKEKTVTSMASEQYDVDLRKFLELGLSPEEARQIHSNKVQLLRLAIDAHDPLMKLAEGRAKYDREVEAALGKEGYEAYRKYEESKPAEREFSLIQEFLIAEGKSPIDPIYQQKLIDLIRKADATTVESWHDPYDPAPQPRAGRKSIIKKRQEQISQTEQTMQVLRKTLAESSLPSEFQEGILSYYSKRIDDWHRSIASASRTQEQINADAERISRLQMEGKALPGN